MIANSNPVGTARFRLYQEKAIAIYESILTLEPSAPDPRALHYAGFSLFQLGRYDEALAHYAKALELAPEYAKVYFNIALVYDQMPGLHPSERDQLLQQNFQRALALTQEAYSHLGEANPRVTFTLAVLYAESGEQESALEYLEKAIRRNPFYITRAEKERAFHIFRTPPDPRFAQLLDRYRPAEQGRFGLEHEAGFNLETFPE